MAHQLRSISKERLGSKCGSISDQDNQDKIKEIIKLHLDLN
ncbi:hypothetical protein [Serpentinicella alkaliphila]|nr:hypothetical protein HZR23_13365 [Serpentinicella alkaliphila]